jgi:hypothetical protein
MSWADVYPLIKFWDQSVGDAWGSYNGTNSLQEFTADDVIFIYQMLYQLYSGSPEAAALLDSAASSGREIRLYQTVGEAPGFVIIKNIAGYTPTLNGGVAGINLSEIEKGYEFNKNGITVTPYLLH